MIKQVVGLQLLMMLLILTSLVQGRLYANQFAYVFPPNISLQIVDQHEEAGKIRLTAIIESRLGILENLELFFESSKDLQVLSNTSVLKSLEAGVQRKIKILAVRTGKPADEIGSWLKIGVKFTPDYKAMLFAVSDTEKYPDENERQKLLDVVAKNSSSGARYLEATRHFINN